MFNTVYYLLILCTPVTPWGDCYFEKTPNHAFRDEKAWIYTDVPLSFCRTYCNGDYSCKSFNYNYDVDTCQGNYESKETEPSWLEAAGDQTDYFHKVCVDWLPAVDYETHTEPPVDSCDTFHCDNKVSTVKLDHLLMSDIHFIINIVLL